MMRIGKYSCREIERRYLLRVLPPGLDLATRTTIIDHYISNTRLRLRLVLDAAGQVLQRKFTQKFIDESQSDLEATITTHYLNQPEYDLLATLPAHRLEKHRYRLHQAPHTYGIDAFQGPLLGLITAEIEFTSLSPAQSHPMPEWALQDITTNPHFRGGNLAKLSASDAAGLLLSTC